MTEKRRDEIAAPAIVARMRTLRSAWMLSDDCFDILVMVSIVKTVPVQGVGEQRLVKNKAKKRQSARIL
jgi:hypothetical protein